MVIVHEGQLLRAMTIQHIAPGNWRGFVQTKLRNIITGTQMEVRFRSDDKVEKAILDRKNVEYLYQDGENYHFMDVDTYDQFALTTETLGEAIKWLTPNMRLSVEMHEERPVGVDLPQTVCLKVKETEPFMRSATVTNSFKAATLETGAVVQVPGFITEGQSVEIDTATGDYVGKAK